MVQGLSCHVNVVDHLAEVEWTAVAMVGCFDGSGDFINSPVSVCNKSICNGIITLMLDTHANETD